MARQDTEQEKFVLTFCHFCVCGNSTQRKLCGCCLFLWERRKKESKETIKHLLSPLQKNLMLFELLDYTWFSTDNTIDRPQMSSKRWQNSAGFCVEYIFAYVLLFSLGNDFVIFCQNNHCLTLKQQLRVQNTFLLLYFLMSLFIIHMKATGHMSKSSKPLNTKVLCQRNY